MTYCTIWICEQHLQHTEVNNGYLDFFLTHIMIHKNYVHGFTKKTKLALSVVFKVCLTEHFVMSNMRERCLA